MLNRTETIHDTIVSELNSKIDEAINDFEDIIIQNQKECEEGNIPNNGFAYELFIRNIRKRALYQFEGIKEWLGTHVLSMIIQQERTTGVYKILKTKESITEITAEKQKVIKERNRIMENYDDMSDFDKYSLYGHPEFEISKKYIRNRKLQNVSFQTKRINPDIELLYQKYKFSRRFSLFIGLVITIICIIVDYSMIYALFLSANYAPYLAKFIAVISAAMLDAPPYVFGYVWTKNDDDKSLFELQGNSNTQEARRKIRGNRIILFAMIIVILFVFISYLIVRFLFFLGGGEFSLAFKAIIEQDWNMLKKTEFDGADFLSISVPMATSMVALAVGRQVYSMRTDYIKDSIIIIKNEINEKIKKCDEIIIDLEKQITDLEESMVTIKKEIWAFYLGRKPFPIDEDEFRLEVSIAFQRLNLSLYIQTYSDSCLLLRNKAITLMRTVNDQLAQYAADQSKIIDMSLSQDEVQYLDELWVTDNHNAPQHQTTQSHLTSIENLVNEILKNIN